MELSVQTVFDCLPLRSVPRWDMGWEEESAEKHLHRRMQDAATRHGTCNSYYLFGGLCVFHLAHEPQQNTVAFRFEGTVLTDPSDQRTRETDLQLELGEGRYDWMTLVGTKSLSQAARAAIVVEFNRYLATHGPAQSLRRLSLMEAESAARGGFVGAEI